MPKSQYLHVGLYTAKPLCFLPQKINQANHCIKTFEAEIAKQNLNIIGWRDVPDNSKVVGSIAAKSQPIIKQVCRVALNTNLKPLYVVTGFQRNLIEKVIRGSSELLKRNGNLILEIDPNQIYETKRIMKNNNFHKINIIKDLSGNYRCIIARKN